MSSATHAEKRRKMRHQLRARGYDEATIEAIVSAKAAEQRQKRDAAREATVRAERHRRQERELAEKRAAEAACWEAPDDSKHRPRQVDPLLVGAARVTGQTAKAVRRRATMTRWEHDGRPE